MDRPIGILTMFYENLLVEYFAELQMCMCMQFGAKYLFAYWLKIRKNRICSICRPMVVFTLLFMETLDEGDPV